MKHVEAKTCTARLRASRGAGIASALRIRCQSDAPLFSEIIYYHWYPGHLPPLSLGSRLICWRTAHDAIEYSGRTCSRAVRSLGVSGVHPSLLWYYVCQKPKLRLPKIERNRAHFPLVDDSCPFRVRACCYPVACLVSSLLSWSHRSCRVCKAHHGHDYVKNAFRHTCLHIDLTENLAFLILYL